MHVQRHKQTVMSKNVIYAKTEIDYNNVTTTVKAVTMHKNYTEMSLGVILWDIGSNDIERF